MEEGLGFKLFCGEGELEWGAGGGHSPGLEVMLEVMGGLGVMGEAGSCCTMGTGEGGAMPPCMGIGEGGAMPPCMGEADLRYMVWFSMFRAHSLLC